MISAFGSSCIPSDDPRYRAVVALGRRLAEAGWRGQTGGHQGMMAAFAEGMAQGGGAVRGVTLSRFPTPPENALAEELRCDDFFERMKRLVEECDAWLVLPGGLGTLSEFAMCWDLKAIRVVEPRPLIFFGDCWPPLLAALERHLVMSVEDAMAQVVCCRSEDAVLSVLRDVSLGR
ncbi:MAG: hypothetical protein D6682_02915 [Zetaproteobacteria bacterium]|nr:MAG: hypothetical protein D6682_02915 [Zetaproteobacteria bacterium]